MSKFKAHSHYQMYRSDFVFSDYSFIDEEGTFRRMNLSAFFTFEDGRRIMASAYQNNYYYLGLPDIDIGSTLELTFLKGKRSSRICLRGVTLIAPPPAEDEE